MPVLSFIMEGITAKEVRKGWCFTMEGRRSGGGRLKRLAEVLYPVAFELSHAGCQPLPTPKGERAHHVINEYEKHMERGIINER